jgi:hypothetical protein
MSKEIFYSFKEYQEKYNGLLDEYYLEFEEYEEIDFIEYEIQKYNVCLQIVNLPIEQAFCRWFRIEKGSDLKTFSISEKTFYIIFENENEQYYYKIYRDFDVITGGVEKKVRQARVIFPKIISFLEQRKLSFETNTKTETPKKDFKGFFKEHINIDKIEEIQKKYKDFDGKKMAYVIYLLHKEFNVINYSLNSRVESRKHFVFALYKKDNINKMEGINRYFNPSDITLLAPDYSKDNDYTTIKTDIQTILNTI